MKKSILFAVGFSKISSDSLAFIDKTFDKEDEVTLLHVVPNVGFSNPPPSQNEIKAEYLKKKSQLEKMAQRLKCKTKISLLKGDVVDQIIRSVQSEHSQMLVISRHNYGLLDRLINGDLQSRILKNVKCPVVCC